MTKIKIFLLSLVFIGQVPCLNAQTLNDLITKADEALQQQEYRTALIHLKNAARQNPDDLSIRLKMAELFIHIGQGVQAQVELDKANKLGGKPVDTAVLTAKARMLLGEFDDLISGINLLDLPQNQIARLRAIQGHAFYEQRKFSSAKQMFQRAMLLSPTEIEVELGQAKLLHLEDNAQQEEQLILSLLDRYNSNAEVLIVAGNYYRKTGDFNRALELFHSAGVIQPSNVNVWFGVVRSYIAKRNYNDAKMEIQMVLTSYPEHQVGNYLLSVIAFQEGDYSRAKAAIDIVLKGEKRKFEALKLLSTIQFQQQEYSEAEKTLQKYLKFHPNDAEALKTLAAVYLKRKQSELALKILLGLEKLDEAYIYSMIATAYMQLGNSDKSSLYISKSIKSAPEDQVIKRHFQRQKLAIGETLELTFTDNDFNNFMSEGHIAILNLLRQKKYNRAIDIIKGYMNKVPDNALLHYLLGSTLLFKDEVLNAKSQFQRSLALNPEFIESRIYLAKIYQQKGNDREAQREYLEVLRIDKNNDQAMIALAGIFNRSGNEDEMLKWLNKSRRVNTASLASREVLEKFFRGKGERKKALDISSEMINIQPQNVKLLLKHANNQKAVNQLDLAIETFQKIVTLKPEMPSAWFGLGRLQYLYNNHASSTKSFNKVLKLEPENLMAKVILVQIDIDSKQFNSALKKAKKLKNQHPKSPAGYDMLGDIYIKLNKPDKAILQYQRSAELKYSSETYIKLHSAYNRNNQIKKGLKLLKKWTAEHPDDHLLKEVLAITYHRRGELENAKKLFEEIIQKSRRNDRVLTNLALVSLDLNSPMSIEYAEMAYNINSDNAINIDTLGWVLFKSNILIKALKLLKEAVEKSPGDPNIRYHFAVALIEHGDKAIAEKHLYLALASKEPFINRSAAEDLLKQIK